MYKYFCLFLYHISFQFDRLSINKKRGEQRCCVQRVVAGQGCVRCPCQSSTHLVLSLQFVCFSFGIWNYSFKNNTRTIEVVRGAKLNYRQNPFGASKCVRGERCRGPKPDIMPAQPSVFMSRGLLCFCLVRGSAGPCMG